jgi:hypothetical protein
MPISENSIPIAIRFMHSSFRTIQSPGLTPCCCVARDRRGLRRILMNSRMNAGLSGHALAETITPSNDSF